MNEEEIKKREEQFSKTISDIENIKCLAQYLLDAIKTGEDPDGEGKEIDYSFVKDICHDIKVFNDSTIMNYWCETEKQAGNEEDEEM